MKTFGFVFQVCIGCLSVVHAYAGQLSPISKHFVEQPKKIERIALVVDALISSDIRGKINGVYRSDYTTLMPVIADGIKADIEAHGYQVTIVHANGGLFATPDMHLVYADDNKSTGEQVVFPVYEANPPVWACQPLRTLMNNVLALKKSELKSGVAKVSVPDEIKKLPVDAIAVVNIVAFNFPMSKTLGISVATGLLSYAVSDAIGSPIYSYLIVSSAGSAMVTIVDTRDGSLLWHEVGKHPGRGGMGGTAEIRPVLVHLLAALPYRNGQPHAPTDARKSESSGTSGSSVVATAAIGEVLASDAERRGAEANPKQVNSAMKRSILVDPNGWTARDARDAYYAGTISLADYKNFSRQMKLDYRKALKKLEESYDSHQINKHQHEVALLRLRWIYRGI